MPPPRLMTPQSLGITPKQPTRPGLEDAAPPTRPLLPQVSLHRCLNHHREGQTLPGTVGTREKTHTLSLAANKPTDCTRATQTQTSHPEISHTLPTRRQPQMPEPSPPPPLTAKQPPGAPAGASSQTQPDPGWVSLTRWGLNQFGFSVGQFKGS